MKYNWKILVRAILNIWAGFYLILAPERVPDWLIVLVGIAWVLEGIKYALDALILHITNE